MATPGKERQERPAKPPLSEKQKTLRALRRLLIKIAVIAAVIAILLIFVGGIAIQHDNNMYPAMRDGDLAITYKLGGYYNGDIVVYEEDGIKKLGRVAGIPGDEIDIREDGTYTVNAVTPYETTYYPTHEAPGAEIAYPYLIQEGEVFVLNDMREDTDDSRMYGGITDVKGKVVLIIRRRGF